MTDGLVAPTTRLPNHDGGLQSGRQGGGGAAENDARRCDAPSGGGLCAGL